MHRLQTFFLMTILVGIFAECLDAEPLRMVEPTDGAEVWLMKPDWRETVRQYAEAEKDADGIGKVSFQAYPEPIVFRWKGGQSPFRLNIIQLVNNKQVKIILSKAGEATVWNLFAGMAYRWELQDANGAVVTGQFHTAQTPRLIALPDRGSTPVNVRDLGGWRTADGHWVRQGMVYRGSELASMPFLENLPSASAENKQFLLEELGIRTDLDLRYEEQVAGRTCSDLSPKVQWLHYAVNAYEPLTSERNALFREALRVFANPSNYPIYVHCSGGADRTGEICFLLEALLGVEDEELFTDYELTSLARLPRPRAIPYFQEWLGRIAAFSPEPGLPYQRQAENYLQAIGITTEEIATIRKLLLEER